MSPSVQNALDKFAPFVPQIDKSSSILERELSDTKGFPSCYLFKNFWIELSPTTEKFHSEAIDTQHSWEALIHSQTQSKTVIAIGSYSTRLEAALKAERLILKWEKPS